MKCPKDYCYYDKDLVDMKIVRNYLESNDIYWNLYECYIVWEAFSDNYCAQFLSVGDDLLEQFVEWIRSD